jgi:RNA polymerase sigma-70 factor, ECF subfamily
MSSTVARYFPSSIAREDDSGPSRSNSKTPRKAETEFAKTIDDTSDEVLISQMCAKDQNALATLFRRYAKTIRSVSYRILRNGAEAEDMVQEVFILAYQNCGLFDHAKGSAKHWLFQIAYRRSISRRRYLSTRHFYTGVGLEDAAAHGTEPTTRKAVSEALIDVSLKTGKMDGVFSDLSKDQQQTLYLFFIEGYTFDEIAVKLGHTRGNVKNHYFRGLEKLRKALFGSKLPGERAV